MLKLHIRLPVDVISHPGYHTCNRILNGYRHVALLLLEPVQTAFRCHSYSVPNETYPNETIAHTPAAAMSTVCYRAAFCLLVLVLVAGTAQAQSGWKKPSFCDDQDCPIFTVAKTLSNGVQLRKYEAGKGVPS
jgi:hypothetical protein